MNSYPLLWKLGVLTTVPLGKFSWGDLYYNNTVVFFFFPLPRYEVAPRSDSEESGSEEEEEVRVRFLAIQALGLCGVTSTTVDAKFLFHPGQTSSGVRDGQGAAEAESSVLRATLFHMVASRHT